MVRVFSLLNRMRKSSTGNPFFCKIVVSGQDEKKIRESSRMRRASPSAKFANRIFSGVRPRLRLIASAAPFGVGRTGKNAGEFFGSSLHVYVFRFSVSDFRFWLDGRVGWMRK